MNEWKEWTDEYGKWKQRGNVILHVEPSQKWIDENLQIDLDSYKQSKIDTLKSLCEQTIEAGFTASNGHFYRTNRDDQTNFIGKKEYLNDHPEANEILWKTEDAKYVSHTREEWIAVFYEALQHKEQQLFKYDQLRNAVNAATTKDEVDATNW